MPHIHTGQGEYDLSVGAFIVLQDGDGEPLIWLHKHRKLGIWLQFGGHAKLTENLWQAITREIVEESGYDIDQLMVLQPKLRMKGPLGERILSPVPVEITSHYYPTPEKEDHYHTDVGFAFFTKELPRGQRREGESSELKAFSASELKLIPEHEIAPDVREISLFILNDILHNWQRVTPTSF